MSGEMYRLTAVGIVLLAVVPNAHARLCVKGNGTVASREACRRHEHEISIATLLPAARASLVTLRNGPIALAAGAQGGTKVAELALPSGERESTRNYVILATASLVNATARLPTRPAASSSFRALAGRFRSAYS
jgi:hypothetical protein